jgi:hypothetical protein
VDDDMANLIVAQLLTLDSTDKKKDITMYVNSPGGSVTAGMPFLPFGTHGVGLGQCGGSYTCRCRCCCPCTILAS